MKEQAEVGEQSMHEHYHVTVDKKQELLRIDKFLMDRIPNTSRTKLQQIIKDAHVLVNEKPIKPNYKVRHGDEISVVLPYEKLEIELVPENIPLDIVYEDEDVIVINKPAGLVVHPGYGNYRGTLVNALLYHLNGLEKEFEGNQRPGLVHRLDKLTTGLMVVAKNQSALNKLGDQFFHRTIERSYVALVWGDIEEEEGTIEGNIGRSLKNRKVMSVFPDGDFGKTAITHFKVLKRYGYVTLVSCKLETGRTHQIRVHFKHFGHPLFGDLEYGGDRILKGTTFTKYKQFISNCFKMLPRQALHAKILGFQHPTKDKFMRFESELPMDLTQVLEKWDIYLSNRDDLQSQQ